MSFHISAIVMMPFGIFVGRKNKIRHKLVYTVLLLIGIWLVSEKLLFYFKYFVMDSELFGVNCDIGNCARVERALFAYGGRVRVWMNVVPVLLYFLLSKNKSLFKEQGGSFWKYLSLATIISIPLVEFFSLATDRINLYFSVIQITVWPRIISIQRSKLNKAIVAFNIFVLYSVVLYVWLNSARNRAYY